VLAVQCTKPLLEARTKEIVISSEARQTLNTATPTVAMGRGRLLGATTRARVMS
jgi:hypothetical protein